MVTRFVLHSIKADRALATPPVQLIYALQASLKNITSGPVSLEERFAQHKKTSQRLKKTVTELGLRQVPLKPDASANGMTAIYAPEGIEVTDIVPRLAKRGIVVAAGLHKDIKAKVCSHHI